MMSFDFFRIARNVGISGFYEVGTESSLTEKRGFKIKIECASGIFSYNEEHVTDDCAFFLGLAGFRKRCVFFAVDFERRVEKLVLGVDSLHLSQSQFCQILADNVRLILAHHAVVDVNSINLIGTKRFDEERCGDRGVNAARNKDNNFSVFTDAATDHVD